MQEINKIIFRLLINNECVILPGFGGFICQNEKAKINLKKGDISPPSKKIGFNPKLTDNDGLLVSAISKKQKLSYHEAQDVIKIFVEDLSRELNSGNRIEIESIGIFYLDRNKNISFEQDLFSNLLLSSYGLKNVSFKPSHIADSIEEKSKPLNEKSKRKDINQEPNKSPLKNQDFKIEARKKKKQVWKYVAAACLLPILFYSFWLPIKSDFLESGIISFSDLNPFHQKSAPIYKSSKQIDLKTTNQNIKTLDQQIESLDSDVSYFSYQFNKDHYVMIKIKDEIKDIKNNSNIISKEIKDTKRKITRGTKSPIVGCFKKQSNAKRLVKKLIKEGFDACVIDINNGLHRVSIGQTSNSNQLTNLIQKADSLGYRNWILKH